MSAAPMQPTPAGVIADLSSVDPQAIVNICKAARFDSKNWGNHPIALRALADWVSKLHVGEKGTGEAWAPATFGGKQRLANMVQGVDLAVFDSDAGHTLADLKAAFLRVGWYARIIPSSSWGTTETEASADHYDAWVKEQASAGRSGADLPERYLVEVLHKTPAVAKGATEISRPFRPVPRKDGGKTLKSLIRFRHGPCEKYRIICVLSQRYDLSTKEARRAWKKHYDAMLDQVELPLDRSTGSPERLFYLSYLSPDRIAQARLHQDEVLGGYIDVSLLPEPKPRERTRRVGRVGTGRVHDQDGGDTGDGFVWIDRDTGEEINLRALAAKGVFQHLELADVLQENGWPQDERGEQDGKHHIECPFAHEHTDQNDGGTFCWNASDYARTGMTDLQPGAGINCRHNACDGRDRLEYILELLDKGDEGGLKIADLKEALAKARAADLDADNFDVIEPDISDPPPPSNRPPAEWVRWLQERMEIKAGHVCEPHLRRLQAANPKSYYEVCLFWDSQELCPDDIPPGVDRAGMNMFGWRLLPEFFDPNQIPDRPWVVEGRLMSGYLTLGSAAPGVGKSNFALLTAISIATGISLTGETIVRQGRVLVHNNEDDFVEMQRRFAGICKHHRIDFDRARENLVFSSGEVQRLVLAIMQGGMVESDPRVDDFIRELKRHGITHVVLDPLVSLQKGVPEIDNSAMDEVAYIIRRIAHDADVSIDLIHHNVKDHSGDSEKRAGDMMAARGGAIIGAARATYTLSRMSKTTAKEYGIPPEQAGAYMRLDGAKANYSAHAGAPIWFRTRSVNIRDDASELTALVSATGEPIEDKEVPRRPPLTVGVHELWLPPSDRPAVEAPAAAQAGRVKEDEQHKLLQLVAEAMPSDRCNVSNVLDAVMKQRGVQDTAARSLIRKAVVEASVAELAELDKLVPIVSLGDRDCTLRIEKKGHVKNGPLWLVRDWLEPKKDD